MALFKSHTLVGKAGIWVKKSGVGKVALGAAAVLTGSAAVLGAVKIGQMVSAAVKDGKVKDDEIVKTLEQEGIKPTKKAIQEVKDAILEKAQTDSGVVLEATQTVYSPNSGQKLGIGGWISANLGAVIGIIILAGVVIVVTVFKPFSGGRKIGRRK